MSKVFKEHAPDPTLELHEGNLIEFFSTMHDRQEIWYNRFIEKQPAPWTTNKIFKHYKFCNSYRELDRSSQWLIHNVISKENTVQDLVWKICVFRLFNKVELFELIDIPSHKDYDKAEFAALIQEFEKYEHSTNKKAYSINSWMSKGMSQGMSNATLIMPSIHEQLGNIMFHGFVGNGQNVKELITAMREVEAIGAFVSHEWFVDMCYIAKYNSQDFGFAYNEDTWTNVGPGCHNGLKLLFPALSPNIKLLRELQELSKDMLDEDFKFIKWDIKKKKYVRCDWNITLTNIEFWCCEYQKYYKIKYKVGKQRDAFVPVTKII